MEGEEKEINGKAEKRKSARRAKDRVDRNSKAIRENRVRKEKRESGSKTLRKRETKSPGQVRVKITRSFG